PYSAFKAFSITFTPTPIAPSGTVTDTTPTYKWTRLIGASQYRYQLLKGTTLVYTKIVGSTRCGTAYCTSTPSTVLSAGSYKWRVQAYVGGVWRAYSTYKAFSIPVPSNKPKAGFWESTTGDEFYVTADQNYVDDFAIYILACNAQYKITHTPLEPITSNHFAFSGAFWANGTFSTTTTVSGQDGITNFYLPYCGTFTATWNYTATWQSASQPLVLTEDQSRGMNLVALVQQVLGGYKVIKLDSPAP
ncbi:MAG: hypothetical protein ACM3QS_14930, partial [Bacteroidota bacterium]